MHAHTNTHTHLPKRTHTHTHTYIQAERLQAYPSPFTSGLVGYVGYEMKEETLPSKATSSPMNMAAPDAAQGRRTPDAHFFLADRITVFDHEEETAYLLCLCRVSNSSEITVAVSSCAHDASETAAVAWYFHPLLVILATFSPPSLPCFHQFLPRFFYMLPF
jgi:anthranilate/para-aminobenzoate synthase component I